MNNLEKYKNNGYLIEKKVLTTKQCKEVIDQLNNIKTDMMIPHTNIQFGYGNIINTDLSKLIIDFNLEEFTLLIEM